MPERVFGRRSTTIAVLNAATGPIRSRTSRTTSASISPSGAVDARLQNDEADGQLALQLVGDADHGALGDVRMRGEHLLHRSGREAVAGDVDDVVGPRHDVDVAVLVDVARVGRLVEARIRG